MKMRGLGEYELLHCYDGRPEQLHLIVHQVLDFGTGWNESCNNFEHLATLIPFSPLLTLPCPFIILIGSGVTR